MSGGGSDPANAPGRRLDELIFAAIHSRAGSSIVDIPTVLDRVDSVERWLLTFEELDSGLRRLSSAGRIAEVDIGRYVSIGSRHPTRPYSGISQEGYDAAVTAYRAAFAVDAVGVMRSPILRGFTSLLRWTYRLTGGRIGLAPGWVDLDAVAITFAVDGVLAPYGAQTGDVAVDGKTLIIPILEGEVPMDRRAVADSVAAALRQHDLQRALVLRFPEHDEVVARE